MADDTVPSGPVPDLASFLLARIAEDEAAWREGIHLATRPEFAKMARHMLAECEAKRMLIADCLRYVADGWTGAAVTDGLAIRALEYAALPYADHPEYRQEWRP